jgi:hypothetical protein
VYEVDDHAGLPLIAMEYVAGRSLVAVKTAIAPIPVTILFIASPFESGKIIFPSAVENKGPR